MDMRVRRAWLPAILAAAFLVVLGWHAVPAHAVTSIDPELVAESVTEDGYYVDSKASYLKTDADLDRLRAALENAGRAGVVVLPAGTPTGPVVSKLLGLPNHKATYVVLDGAHLQAVSNNLSRSTVTKLTTRARTAGNPQAQVLSFLTLMNPHRHQSSSTGQKDGNLPTTQPSDDAQPDASTAPTAAKKSDSGSNTLIYAVGGLVVLLIVACGAFLIWRNKKSSTGSQDMGPGSGGF